MKTTEFIVKKVKVQEAIVEAPVVQPEVELSMPEFTFESAEAKFEELLSENASCGATGTGSIAVSFTQEGNMPTDIIKRQKGYTNQLSKGGTVKVKK